MTNNDDAYTKIHIGQLAYLQTVEKAAQEAVRYHVAGYGKVAEEEHWDANHMLALLDKLAKVLDE
jgi:hypothetical protein